jgi:MFS transporter, YNFM family, putative membrane transport protein
MGHKHGVLASSAQSTPPSGAARVEPGTGALLALGMAGFCAFLNVYTAQPLLPLLAASFGASKAAAGLTVSAPSLAVALLAPVVGAWATRFPLHRVIGAALWAMVVPTLLAATAPSLPALIAWRFAQGMTVPGVYAVGVAYAAGVWPAPSLGKATAALVTGNVLGGFCGRLVAGVAADLAGWRAAFVVLGILTAAGAAATWRLLPPSARLPGARPEPAWRAVAALLRSAPVLATMGVGFSVLFTQVATFTYVTFHLAGPRFGFGASGLSAVFGVYLVGAAVTPAAGRWIARLGARRIVGWSQAVGLVASALLLVPAVWAVVLGLALFCSASFVNQAAATAWLPGAAGPAHREVASGLYIASYYLGGATGGVLPASAWALGGWTACVLLVAAAQLVTLALVLRWWSPRAAAA